MADSITGIGRRRAVAGVAGALLLGGCDRIEGSAAVKGALARAEGLTRRVQALVSPRGALAREYSEADISPEFRGNGTVNPDDEDYQDMAANGFADWRLEVGGLVERPLHLSLAELRALPSRAQITRHDCVEGWSCIGKWKGATLGPLLRQAGLRQEVRYIVFHCADPPEGGDPNTRYYESIDVAEAVHPQTILAYDMNDAPLTVRHGAPVRLRVERQLGYKMAKYVMRIEAVESFGGIGGGKGGFWEDRGYAWYAGI
ncbi:MAG TPA: molybdopterin-dependent oxidoreductase [Acetobacteraceae bacterium]|nr:molybdopterin-dependent oxidoreductase [Acetobacteraceae bacterium]